MNHTNKGKAKVFSAWLCSFLFILLTFYQSTATRSTVNFHIHLTADTIPPKVSTEPRKIDSTDDRYLIPSIDTSKAADTARVVLIDTTGKKPDSTAMVSVDTFNFKIAKGALDVPITYHADDSMVLDVPNENILLYGKKSTVLYGENNLEAPHIEYNQKTNLVSAHLTKDSLGKVISYPKFTQGSFESSSDTILFNIRTEKGITKGTYTRQGEMYVYGQTIKKTEPDVFYALKGRFTTCNLDTPHFAFVSNKIKFIQNKMAFTGPVHPEFEGVPVPIILPFGIYPLTQGRHSGLIAPSLAANNQMGLSLEGLGYYKILSPVWDVIFRGTIYSYGGWAASLNPRYYKRYRYRGNLGIDMQRFKINFKGDNDYQSNRTINVRWTHSMDSKARPGVSFTANVDAGSSRHNEQVPNNNLRNFQNQLTSSITYAKVWKPFNISVSANHNQNTQLRLINLNMPDVAFNVNTLYPLRRAEPIGAYKWYENIGLALNTQARSLTSFYDTAGNIGSQIADRLQWGASHNVPITLSLPALGPVQVSPSVTYQERWYDQKLFQTWNPVEEKIDTMRTHNFYRAYEMTFGVGVSTRVFGMYTFKKGRVKAIRHEIRPSISANYKPDLNSSDWYTVQTDTAGNTRRYSSLERGIFGAYSPGRFGGMSFGIENNLTMKVRDKKDTSATADKKVSLIDGFGITGSYNFLRDSFKLDPLNVSARSNLFNKISITASGIFDPYQADSIGRRVDKLIWAKRPWTLGSLTSGFVSLQTSFRGGDKKNKASTPLEQYQQNLNTGDMPLDEYQQELSYMQNNPGEFVDFSIPWDISLSYSLRFSRIRANNNREFITDLNQDVSFNSSVNLTPKWKVGLNGFYNITNNELGTISMYLSREMHCWQMAINVSPVGKFKYFNITISPKSNILRDLKINRTRSFYDF